MCDVLRQFSTSVRTQSGFLGQSEILSWFFFVVVVGLSHVHVEIKSDYSADNGAFTEQLLPSKRINKKKKGTVTKQVHVGKMCPNAVQLCLEQVWPWSWWTRWRASWPLGTATPTSSLPLWTPSTSIARSRKVRKKPHSDKMISLSCLVVINERTSSEPDPWKYPQVLRIPL